MKKTLTVQKIALIGVLAALSLGIFVIEAQIPSPNIAGIKLGLANVVTLCAMLFAGRIAAGCVLGIKIVLAAAFYGTFISFMFSLCGGALAFAVMSLLVNRFDKKQIWVVSVFGALAHNAGQLCVAAVLLSGAVTALIPYLVISGIATGALTGITAQRLWFSPLRRFAVNK
ncbi:MAG: Gx transporter family protein [Ruminococcus sp.]|nr:Gx transporter family protein [Ruminococcus sp.]